MEAFGVLERKVTELLLLVSQLKAENAQLAKENVALKRRMGELEEGSQERTIAKAMVDSLIKDIDAIVKVDNQL